jgi:Ion channel
MWLAGAAEARLVNALLVALGPPATTANSLYHSFATLTTVDYGDLTARADLGHTLSIFKARTGQIDLATVVAPIVGKLGRRPLPD